jgi:hypothetical protein
MRLAADHESGEWYKRRARLADLDELDLGYRVLTTCLRGGAAATLIR